MDNFFNTIFVSAFVPLIILFPVFLIRGTIVANMKRNGAAVQKAINRNHVVTARLIKTHWKVPDDPKNVVERYSLGVYEYTYKGKRYKYKLTAMDPPEELTLYFLNNPRKARTALDMKVIGFPWGYLYLGIFILVFIILFIVHGG